MSIQDRLRKYPVPDFVWEEYHLDQEINDRGIALDRTFVKNAIAFDAKSKAELSEKMQELTNLDNPNSVQQMKQWLADNGLEMDSLGKKEVAAVLKIAPEPLRTVLTLRRKLAKSSVKKYQAMENAVWGRQSQRNVHVLWCKQDRQVCRPHYTAAESSSKPYAGLGTGTRTCQGWKLYSGRTVIR